MTAVSLVIYSVVCMARSIAPTKEGDESAADGGAQHPLEERYVGAALRLRSWNERESRWMAVVLLIVYSVVALALCERMRHGSSCSGVAAGTRWGWGGRVYVGEVVISYGARRRMAGGCGGGVEDGR